MSYVKNYNVGQIQLDLPTSNYMHELPLLSFADIHGNVNLSLVFNYGLRAESSNPFNIAAGYKLNMQKRIVMSNSAPTAFQSESGKVVALNSADTCYAFDDDTQRIIRRTGSTYELENPDFSKECYDQVGKITKAYDKYGVLVLSYAYDSGGKLTSITYRSEKTISFTYDSSNRLNKVTYAGKNISLAYKTSGITLTHYTGVTFTLTSSGMNFSATATATENSTAVSYATKITKNSNYILAISNLVDGSTVNTTTYKFPGIVTSYNTNFSQVEITDNFGVVTRIQYNDDKPCYSYEIMRDTDSQDEDIFFEDDDGNQIYKGTVSINTEDFSGVQRVNDGIRFGQLTNDYISWRHIFTGTTSLYGNFIVSGWIYASEGESYTITVKDIYSGKEFDGHTISNLTPGVWNYFSFKTYMSNPKNILVSVNKSDGLPICFDVRMMFEEGKIYSSNDINHFTVMKDVLVKEGTGASNEKIIPLDSTLRFYKGNSRITKKFTANDILRYKLNQKLGMNKNEIYYDNCKGIITNAGVFAIEYDEEVNGSTQTTRVNIDNIAVGKKSIRNDKTHLTKMNFYTDSDGNSYFSSKMYINDTEVKSERYDDKFDIVSSTNDGITSTFVRTNGLITSESVQNLYTRTTTYAKDSDNNPTVTFTDEFNNTTVYTFDRTWGVVKTVLMPDGTIVTDEYDDDMCARIKRTFGSSNGQSILYSYSKGNISRLQTDNLYFDFTYSKGDMTAVKKFGVNVEEHEYSDTSTNSYYPSKSSKVYQNTVNYDKYGRVISIGDEITNVYNISPEFNSSGDIVGKPNNAGSVLAMSTDHKTNQVARYEYNDNKTLKKKTVTGSSFSSKVSEETFTYDAINRVKSHSCTYDVSNSKSVSGNITYVKAETDPSADNRIYTYAYNVNGVRKAYSYNNYDAFNRLTTKGTTVGNQGLYFTRAITYNKTRVSKVADTFSGANRGTDTYGYDALGRITSHSYSSASTSDSKTYVYDNCGQLIRENNSALDKTFIYCYNNIGNITSVKTYAYTTDATPTGTYTEKTYTYDSTNKDRLTNFNGNSITYNSLGCPQYYDNKTWTWTKGKLTRIHCGAAQQPGTLYEDCVFNYDAYGRRLSKSYTHDPNPASTSDYSYTYNTTYNYDNSGRLIREYCVDRYTYSGGGSNSREFIYLYDESGIIGVLYSYNGSTPTPYYYHRNLQGDVIAIYDASGNVKAEYTYDAWGNCTVTNSTLYDLAHNNPIRYRGYYYDRETRLYYLNARYYNPEWRRFISPDDTAYLDPQNVNGCNLYAYCNNDPVNYADPSGHESKWWAWLISGIAITTGIILSATGVGGILGGILIGAGAGSLINGYVNEANGGSFIAGYIGGAISGALCGTGAGLGGLAFAAATKTAGALCMGYLSLGMVASFSGGFLGNLFGTMYTDWHNSGHKSVQLNPSELISASLIMGTLNIFAGIGSGISSIVGGIGRNTMDINSRWAYRILAATIAGGTEASYDLISYILSYITH